MGNKIRTKLASQGYLLFDGAMGTFLDEELKRTQPDLPPVTVYETVNLTNPQLVKRVHQQYINAGAQCIKTNTFGANTAVLRQGFAQVADILVAGYGLAQEAVADSGAFVFADIGPILAAQYDPDKHQENRQAIIAEYKKIADVFLALGAECFLFETLNHDFFLPEVTQYIKEEGRKKGLDPFIIAQFAITADGFTNIGISAKRIWRDMSRLGSLDALGFNCICGPTHLLNYLKKLPVEGRTISIMPNAGYPVTINNRTVFDSSPAYFAEKTLELRNAGVKIIGGCCGTTPEHIFAIARALQAQQKQAHFTAGEQPKPSAEVRQSGFLQKLQAGKKVAAVEVEPPMTNDIGQMLATAEKLKLAGADCLTIADCPIARVKADSCMMSAKLKKELDIEVIPHLTCRDRNINATKALLLGLQIEGVQNVLLVTGDPLPATSRDQVKSVFNLNSSRLCNYVANLNAELFSQTPFAIGAALNVNASNFEQELKRAKQKMEDGAVYFLSQAIYSEVAIQNFYRAKEALGAYLLAGMMPIVSYRNACFINNEISGIVIPDEICRRFQDQPPEECRKLALATALAACEKLRQAADGYYLTTPLHKTELMTGLLDQMAAAGFI